MYKHIISRLKLIENEVSTINVDKNDSSKNKALDLIEELGIQVSEEFPSKNEVYVIMCLSEVHENRYFTDEDVAKKRVESLNNETFSQKFWCKRLLKLNC